MKKLTGVIALIVCIPLIASIFVKTDKSVWKQNEEDTSALNEYFKICVKEDIGTYYYEPESMTELLMYRFIPEDMLFSSSEDFIVSEDTVHDFEQEYLKALSIVCRSNIVAAWEAEQCPDLLDFGKMQIDTDAFYKILQIDAINTTIKSYNDRVIKFNEIKRAADATKGAVITRDGKVITAPFFTTAPSDMFVREAGSGTGFSLNYAYELAVSGMDFYAILKYFYDNIRVAIYE